MEVHKGKTHKQVHLKVNHQVKVAQEEDNQVGKSGQEQSSEQVEGQNIAVTEMQNNSILNLDTEDIDWEKMKTTIESLNTSWGIITIDLENSNVFYEDITEFNKLLNDTIISIKNEDKETTLTNLTNLYSYVPKFLVAISADKHTQNIETTKYHIYIAYALASKEEWEAVSTNLTEAESTFLSIVNDTQYFEKNKFKVNKTHSLMKNLQTTIINNDKELFFLKYKNLVESMNTL